MSKARSLAVRRGADAGAASAVFFRPQEPLFRLSDETQKLRLLAASGADGAIVLTFNAALAAFRPRILSQNPVERFAVSGAAVGFDFHFGKNRVGSPAS